MSDTRMDYMSKVREKSPLPSDTVVCVDSINPKLQLPKVKVTADKKDVHPVRGDPVFIPGVFAMVFGFTLTLAGSAYNASLDSNAPKPLAMSLIGVGVFMLIFGEMFCVFICFLRWQAVNTWNSEHTQRKRTKKSCSKRGSHRVANIPIQSYELYVYSQDSGPKKKVKTNSRPRTRPGRGPLGRTTTTPHGPPQSVDKPRLTRMPTDPPSYEEALKD